MISNLILARFGGHIVSPTIELLLDYPQIFSLTLEMSNPWHEEVCWRSHIN